MRPEDDAQGLLHHLPKEQLDALLSQGTVRAYGKSVVIVSEGDRSDSLYFILSGSVRVFLSDANGKELELEVMGPGRYFGEMVLDGGPRSASVMTIEPSRFCVVTADQFRGFLRACPEASLELIRGLMARIRRLTRVAGDFALMDIYGRVARLLLELAEEQDSQLVIRQRLTQQAIANRVGASREMISRILKDLREGGYIREEGSRTVVVRRPPARW